MSNNRKVVLITGAARRIGAEIARILHHAGWNVLLHYNNSEKAAQALCEELNNQYADSARIIKADLSQINAINQMLENAMQEWDRLDCLINNAAQFYKTHVGEVTETSWNKLLDTNLKAPYFLSQAAQPYLKKTQGCIVNIADIHAEKPLRDYSVYCISKAGLIMLTKTLAKEFAPDIRVNAISPAGGAIWPEGENSFTEAEKIKIIAKTALKRVGSPRFIAQAVLYFIQHADFVTGQVLSVDGGRL